MNSSLENSEAYPYHRQRGKREDDVGPATGEHSEGSLL